MPGILRKFGPLAPVFGLAQYYTQPGAVFGTALVAGQPVATVMYTPQDNLPGDGSADLALIVDPAGPAVRVAEPAPVMSGRGAVVVVLGGVGLLGLARLRHQ